MMRRENSAKKRKKKETIYQQLTVEHLIFTVVVHRLVVASFHGDLLTMGGHAPMPDLASSRRLPSLSLSRPVSLDFSF